MVTQIRPNNVIQFIQIRLDNNGLSNYQLIRHILWMTIFEDREKFRVFGNIFIDRGLVTLNQL